MKTIYLQQPIIADYRMGLFHLLREEWGHDFQVYAGDTDFGGSPVSTPEAWKYYERVRNIYLFGGRFLWQWGCFRQLLAADVAVLNGNMRMLSNNVLLIVRKLLGRPTLVWAHVEGQNKFASAMRGVYLRLCVGFIAYTENQGDKLAETYPWLKVWVASNSCVSSSDCKPVLALPEDVDSILYVGRLVQAKKVRLLLEAYIQAIEQGILTKQTRLIFIGDGTARLDLENRVQESGLCSLVTFAGHISDVQELRKYYRKSICSVSPGYVGLSATQSFSFGIPMLIARDEFHSPEIEACQDGFNASFFASDDAEALAGALSLFVENKSKWLEERAVISEWTRAHYSFEVMRDTFVQAVEEVGG